MLTAYLRLGQVGVLASALLPTVVLTASYLIVLPVQAASGNPELTAEDASLPIQLSILGAALTFLLTRLLLERGSSFLVAAATRQAAHLDEIPENRLLIAIAASACASLFLELAVIRWLGETLPVFAFYKNFGLLVCFAGLGLGYALARRDAIPLVLVLPLLGVQCVVLLVLRYGLSAVQHESLWTTPFREQLNMGIGVSSGSGYLVPTYWLLASTFLLVALAFVPVGQLCGRLMTRCTALRAYGFNLIGSLGGIALMLLASSLWTPPLIWFGACFAMLLCFQLFDSRVLLASALSALAISAALAWPVSPGVERIHTPYQIIERDAGERGLTSISAAGHYYQRVIDLSLENANRESDPGVAWMARHYDFPYEVLGRRGVRVAIVGAGMGNDVAAALRSGAQNVDAVEIDPGILHLGRRYHPEAPYSDPRAWAIVNDARSFFRTTDERYDLIVFGLLDSHTVLSHSSSVRLDSFVYTVEAFREARRALTTDGVLSLSFFVLTVEMGGKIFGMLSEAFDGRAPICVNDNYDGSYYFLQSREGDLQVDPVLLTAVGSTGACDEFRALAGTTDFATDDWPFLYMPRRVYPWSFLGMMVLAVALTLLLMRSLGAPSPASGGLAFFFLGAGFMLVETKAITELGLSFGNTWQVVGVAIAGVLVMAYLANTFVQLLGPRKPALWFALLVASLLAGYAVSAQGGFAPTLTGKLATIATVTVPLLFSGVVFSTLLARYADVSAAMSMNLLGALTGGLLEYNALYLGYRGLYLLAIALYATGAVAHFARRPVN